MRPLLAPQLAQNVPGHLYYDGNTTTSSVPTQHIGTLLIIQNVLYTTLFKLLTRKFTDTSLLAILDDKLLLYMDTL